MGRKEKKKRPEDSGPEGAPEWVVTFTDMISLLVTFFVLLMTFSSLDAYDVLKVDAWLTGKGGIHSKQTFVLPKLPEEDLVTAANLQRGSFDPHSRPAEELVDDIEEMGQKKTLDRLELDLSRIADGLLIEFGEEDAFAPGSVALTDHLRKSLDEMGRVFEHYPHLIVVEGFTDGAFVPDGTYSSAEALSFARAAAAADTLLSQSKLSPELVQIAGLGAQNPRGDNTLLDGRKENRRVQLRVLSLSRARASHYDAIVNPRRKEDG